LLLIFIMSQRFNQERVHIIAIIILLNSRRSDYEHY
jgi:hypothetical protein